jgi:PAS domain S-box-containing protein
MNHEPPVEMGLVPALVSASRNRIRAWLSPPVFEDGEKTRVASLLNTMLLTILASAAAYVVATPFVIPHPALSWLSTGMAVVPILSALFLMRRGRVRLASALLCLVMWSAVTLLTVFSGGVSPGGSGAGYMVVVLASGLLLGEWAGIGVAGLSGLAGTVILWAEVRGLLPPPLILSTAISSWMVVLADLVIVTILLHLASGGMRHASERARRHEQALAQSNRDLAAEIGERKRAEAALRESEESLRRAQRIAHTGSWALDLHTNELSISEEMGRIFKYEALHTRSVPLDEFVERIHPLDRELVSSAFNETIASGAPHDLEFRVIRADGEPRILHSQGEVIKDETGRPVKMVGIGLDVTERRQADEALNRWARELATLNAVGRRVGASLSLEEVAQAALDEIVPLVGPDLAMLFLHKDERLSLQAKSQQDTILFHDKAAVHVVGERLCGLAVDEGEPIYCPDIRNEARCGWEEEESAGVFSFAALPLRSGETVIGVLELVSATERDFGEDAAFLETLADQVAIGIQNALLHQEVERRWRELSTLYGASLILSQSLDPEVIGQTLIELMEQHLAYEHGGVAVVDKERQVAIPLAVSTEGQGQDYVAQAKEHLRSLTLRQRQGIVAWVIEHGEPVRLGDVTQDPRYYTLTEEVRSELCVPLKVGERVIGALNVESGRPDAYDEQDEWLLTALAGPAAVAIENARLYEQVRDYAATLERHVAERTAELESRVAEVERLNRAMTNLLQDLQASNQKLEEVSQELRRTNAELETFAYSVSHDLKAPLRGIDGYSRLLLKEHADRLDDDGQTFVRTICRAATEMNQLIDDLLAYSRLERRTVHTTQVALLPLVEAVIAEFEAEIQAQDVELRVDLPCETATAEAEGLSQALRNLLSNALKFSDSAAQPQVEIGGQVTGEVCTISVRDNGIGFDMQYHDRIFEIFQRLHRAEDYPGTGVGLAIVRKAAQRMGGRVWAESAPGEGATFFLEIPR